MAERRSGGDLLRALRGALTPRGSAFFVAALAALLVGEVLGERDLISIAALLAALPLAAVVVVARSRYRIRLRRTLTPQRVEAGREARVLLRMENMARLPTTTLLMEDTLPYALGGRPRFVLRGLESTGVREVTYGVRTEHRGHFEIGPLTVRVSDPFGCAEVTRSFSSVETLTVTPVVWDLPPVRIDGSWLGGGEGRSTTVAATGEADVSIREYREGDDLRRIHWKATARTGELMVRRDEQPRLSRGSILLDTRTVAHRGDGPSASFEWAVSAAASIGMWLSRRGYALRLVTVDGAVSTSSSPSIAASQLLDSLAVVATARTTTLAAALPQMANPGGGGGLTVAVLGLLERPEAERIAALGPASGSAVAILLDAPSWQGGAAVPDARVAIARDVLASAGWRVLVARQDTDLAALWPEAARRATRSFDVATAGGAGR